MVSKKTKPKGSPPAAFPVAMPTGQRETPDQFAIDFFNQGFEITSAPDDVVMRKSNAAINMVNTLGHLELKIVDACMYVAKSRMSENTLHAAGFDYFKWLISYNSQNRAHLKRAFENIQRTLIQINIMDESHPDKDIWRSTSLLYDVGIARGQVFFRIPESIRDALANPHSWTYLSFRIKNRFTSEYSYRLYGRCRAEQYRGATEFFTLDEFRKIMNVADSYPEFQDLNKRVIKPGVEQINQHSDIFITPDYKTRGKAKTHIRFIIESNPNTNVADNQNEHLPAEIYEALKNEFGLSNSDIDEFTRHPVDYLTEKIEFSRYRIKNSKTEIKRPDRYLRKALDEDLRFNASEIERFEAEKRARMAVVADKAGEEAVRVAHERKNALFEAFQRMETTEQNLLLASFKTSKHNSSFLQKGKYTLKDGVFKAAFIEFLKENPALVSRGGLAC